MAPGADLEGAPVPRRTSTHAHSPTASLHTNTNRTPPSTSRPTNGSSSPRTHRAHPKRRKQKSLEELPLNAHPHPHIHYQPAFILSPLSPLSSLSALPTSSVQMMQHQYRYDDWTGTGPETEMETERPRRASSSPQLLTRTTRSRSSSASSSASLTATEDNYARLRSSASTSTSSSSSARPGPGPSASTSRFPNTYQSPPLWTRGAAPSSPMSADGPSDASDSEDGPGRDEDDLIFVARPGVHASSSSSSSGAISGMRNRRCGQRERRGDGEALPSLRMVTTARGQPCAGETETELDEMPQRLPTARNVTPRPVVPLLIDLLVPILFQITRFLSIIPATFGTLYNMYHVFYPPDVGDVSISSIDYVVSALWAILVGFQCLYFTTGLLMRWKAYYTTPSTLIRLIALQCICWPAAHLTLAFFDHTRRPVACWALIGTTTCLSRSVQLWVTSNLYVAMPVPKVNGCGRGAGTGLGPGPGVMREGRVGARRWDWGEVIVKCAVPAGMLYFVTAWGMILKEELRHFHFHLV